MKCGDCEGEGGMPTPDEVGLSGTWLPCACRAGLVMPGEVDVESGVPYMEWKPGTWRRLVDDESDANLYATWERLQLSCGSRSYVDNSPGSPDFLRKGQPPDGRYFAVERECGDCFNSDVPYCKRCRDGHGHILTLVREDADDVTEDFKFHLPDVDKAIEHGLRVYPWLRFIAPDGRRHDIGRST